MIKHLASAVICAALALPSAAHSQVPMPPSDPARRAIWSEVNALNDSMTSAFNRGELARVAKFYADTAIIQGSSGPATKGRAAVDQYWTSIRNAKRWELDVIEVGGPADMPYQVGRSRLVMTDASGTERVSAVDFVVIWQRGPDKVLRIAYDLYSPS
jgi:ketosteroid isomerase-like protein